MGRSAPGFLRASRRMLSTIFSSSALNAGSNAGKVEGDRPADFDEEGRGVDRRCFLRRLNVMTFT